MEILPAQAVFDPDLGGGLHVPDQKGQRAVRHVLPAQNVYVVP
jgi:hypothetical protein